MCFSLFTEPVSTGSVMGRREGTCQFSPRVQPFWYFVYTYAWDPPTFEGGGTTPTFMWTHPTFWYFVYTYAWEPPSPNFRHVVALDPPNFQHVVALLTLSFKVLDSRFRYQLTARFLNLMGPRLDDNYHALFMEGNLGFPKLLANTE